MVVPDQGPDTQTPSVEVAQDVEALFECAAALDPTQPRDDSVGVRLFELVRVAHDAQLIRRPSSQVVGRLDHLDRALASAVAIQDRVRPSDENDRSEPPFRAAYQIQVALRLAPGEIGGQIDLEPDRVHVSVEDALAFEHACSALQGGLIHGGRRRDWSPRLSRSNLELSRGGIDIARPRTIFRCPAARLQGTPFEVHHLGKHVPNRSRVRAGLQSGSPERRLFSSQSPPSDPSRVGRRNHPRDMESTQSLWTQENGWTDGSLAALPGSNLVLVFGDRDVLEGSELLPEISATYPDAYVMGCSTAGEIHETRVRTGSVSATAVRFHSTQVESAEYQMTGGLTESHAAGVALAESLTHEGLRHVFVLSDGVQVNGSQLVAGLESTLPQDVTISGGLAGDGADFAHTSVIAGGRSGRGQIAAVGLYGDHLQVGSASLGGWDPFGPTRKITKSVGNVLYELDGKPALGLYKRYLGEHSTNLPASGLLFPLTVCLEDGREPVVRTILAVDEATGSMTFAGDVPEGARSRLMRANFDRLVEGASGAATASTQDLGEGDVELAILISCVGRKMVLRQRVDDEVEAVRAVLGDDATLTGFYSYGEISPFTTDARAELHNQTMTITSLVERRAA